MPIKEIVFVECDTCQTVANCAGFSKQEASERMTKRGWIIVKDLVMCPNCRPVRKGENHE
jgi:hypothetical protein